MLAAGVFACSGDKRAPIVDSSAEQRWIGTCAEPSRPGRPPMPDGALGPAIAPSQAPPDGKRVYPTNQWWTSLLTAPRFPVWAQPLAVRLRPGSMELSIDPPVVSPNAIVQGFVPSLTIGLPDAPVAVDSWGDFHVVAAIGSARVTIAQGTPTVWVTVAGSASIKIPADATVVADGALASVTRPGGDGWDVVASDGAAIRADGRTLGFTIDGPISLAITARPGDAAAEWRSIIRDAGPTPVVATTSEWDVRPGVVRQRLTWRRDGPSGIVAVAPHHWARLVDAPVPLGSFTSARGVYRLVQANAFSWDAPLPGVLAGVARVEGVNAVLAPLWKAAVERATNPTSAGSYGGPKELGHRATVFDYARAYADSAVTEALRADLTKQVDGWFGYGAAGDDRWLAYEPVWGGMIASTAEFGNEDYNDHHFHYGYLIQAAASIAEVDEAAAQRWKPFVSLLADDLGLGRCRAGFPTLRTMNPYEGHSYASGFGMFADGNNHESSSEAVHAWWALLRWATAIEDTELRDRALAFYAIETASARTYMLGIDNPRPIGFDHPTIGILWGSKVDFATWFDPRPASVVGIQLLPFTYGSLYRSGGEQPRARAGEGAVGSGSHWSDLLAMELAMADAGAAREALATVDSYESANSELLVRGWVETLDRLGRPDDTVEANPPIGLAFRNSAGRLTFVAVNASAAETSVTFTGPDGTSTAISVPARGSVVQPQ